MNKFEMFIWSVSHRQYKYKYPAGPLDWKVMQIIDFMIFE